MSNPHTDSSNEIVLPVILVTGLSGAGMTTSLKFLEDLGYEAVDNLPIDLVPALIALEGDTRPALAIGLDCRTRKFSPQAILSLVEELRQNSDIPLKLVFLRSDLSVLQQRFTATRRRHPLAVDRPLADGIKDEMIWLAPLRDQADEIIDTSLLAPRDLQDILRQHFILTDRKKLQIMVYSFSYRQGIPREADLVFDMRFLRNPHWEDSLRPLSGEDRQVQDFIAADPGFPDFFTRLTEFIAPLIPRYIAEGKSYLTIACGCTGGRHRSVFVACLLASYLKEKGQQIHLLHRDSASFSSQA